MKIRSPRYAREIPQRYRYEAAKAENGDIFFPPRVVYPNGMKVEPHKLCLTGKVLTYTIIRTGPEEHSDLQPFAIGIVELEDGARITTQIVDLEPSEVTIGLPVRIEFRKIRSEGDEGLLCYGYKAVPVR